VSKVNPKLIEGLEGLDHGFSALYNILIDAYAKEIGVGKNPDVEGLKELASEYTVLRNFLASNSNLELELSPGLDMDGINIFQVSEIELQGIINRLKKIFGYLTSKAQSFVL